MTIKRTGGYINPFADYCDDKMLPQNFGGAGLLGESIHSWKLLQVTPPELDDAPRYELRAMLEHYDEAAGDWRPAELDKALTNLSLEQLMRVVGMIPFVMYSGFQGGYFSVTTVETQEDGSTDYMFDSLEEFVSDMGISDLDIQARHATYVAEKAKTYVPEPGSTVQVRWGRFGMVRAEVWRVTKTGRIYPRRWNKRRGAWTTAKEIEGTGQGYYQLKDR